MWNLYVSEKLATLGLCKDFPVATNYPQQERTTADELKTQVVDWDHMKIVRVDEAPLMTFKLACCFALCARGYNEEGQLTHLGMAHWYDANEDFVTQFFKRMREVVGTGKIELFVAGGMKETEEWINRIITDAAISDTEISHNVSLQLVHKFRVLSSDKQRYHQAWSGIESVWFNKAHEPCLTVDIEFVAAKELDNFLRLAREGQTISITGAQKIPTHESLQALKHQTRMIFQ